MRGDGWRAWWCRLAALPLAARALILACGAVVLALLVLATFPWGALVGTTVRPLSRAIGRDVSIGAARRLDWFSLTPEIVLTDVTIAQPAWIGAGEMARIREVRIRLPVLPLLIGRFRPHDLVLDGVSLHLVRTAGGRASWDGRARRQGDRPRPTIAALTIRDGTVDLDDRRRHVRVAGTLAADAQGLRIDARGTLRDAPLALAVRGGAITGAVGGRPYPLRVVARSPLVRMDARVRMDRPLDTAAFTGDITAQGRDLDYLDDLLQAGLFPTRSFGLSGHIRRDGDRWAIRSLDGVVGRSRLTGRVDVERRGARTGLDATIDAATLDFDDFSSAEQRARAAAAARRLGDRIIPGTRLQLGGLGKVDGTIRLRARHLLVPPGSPFRALDTTASLDHGRLLLHPLDISLVTGHVTGSLTDDDRTGTPRVTLDLTLAGGTVETLLAKSGSIRGPLSGRLRLSGRGATLREAMGRADGSVGLAVPNGTARRDYATFAGGNVGGSLGAAMRGAGQRVALRCLVGRFVARGGRLVPDPLVIDTAVSRADGHGVIDLGDERLDLAMVGRAKQPGLLRSTAPTRITGTLADPKLDIRPPRAPDDRKTGALARVGYFLKGLKVRTEPSDDPAARDADCAALIRKAIG